MNKFELANLEIDVAPTGTSDAVGAAPCAGVLVGVVVFLFEWV